MPQTNSKLLHETAEIRSRNSLVRQERPDTKGNPHLSCPASRANLRSQSPRLGQKTPEPYDRRNCRLLSQNIRLGESLLLPSGPFLRSANTITPNLHRPRPLLKYRDARERPHCEQVAATDLPPHQLFLLSSSLFSLFFHRAYNLTVDPRGEVLDGRRHQVNPSLPLEVSFEDFLPHFLKKKTLHSSYFNH